MKIVILSLVVAVLALGSDKIDVAGMSEAELEADFKCPESYPTLEEKSKSLKGYLQWVIKLHPDWTNEQVQKHRVRMLETHGCQKTLHYMRYGWITFLGKEYGPYVKVIDNNIKVRSVYYPLKGQKQGDADEEIIFNFYIQNLWTNEAFTTRDVANLFVDSSQKGGPRIIYKFQAPDSRNKKPAFFFASYSAYPGEGYGYAFVSKVASIGDDVYSVIFSKKIAGKGINIGDTILKWFLENQEYVKATHNIQPDESWLEVFRR